MKHSKKDEAARRERAMGDSMGHSFIKIVFTIAVTAVLLISGCKGTSSRADSTPHSISGSILLEGSGLPGVLLTLSGATTGTAVTDSAGNFAFANIRNGSYTMTPSKEGFTFNPPSLTVTVEGSDVTEENFIPVPVAYTISGTVTENGGPLVDVLLTLTGGETGTTMSDALGHYSFKNIPNGTYTITPSKIEYTFTPSVLNVVVKDADQTVESFTGVAGIYVISGAIISGGSPLSGVTLALSGSGAGMTSTDANGKYQFTELVNGQYVITPFKSNYVFIPAQIAILVSGASITGQSFTGAVVSAATRTIPDTGQTSCYDPVGAIINCAGTGQDGEYTINPPSYTDNGDGTITDIVTGLVWQKQDDGTARIWDDANTYCSGNSPGLPGVGWRLPTSAEINTIVDYGRANPAIDTKYFPKTQSGIYWSSTSLASDPSSAWYQIFQFGFVLSDVKTTAYYVRCVR